MFLATAESYTKVSSIQLDLASQPPKLMQFDISIFSLTFSKFYANILTNILSRLVSLESTVIN